MATPEPELEKATKTSGAIIKLADVANATFALQRLAALPLRMAMSVKVFKLLKALQPAQENIDKQRKILFERYGELSEDGQQYTVPAGEKLTAFQKEYAELLEQTDDLTVERIKLSDIEAAIIDDASLPAADIFALEFLLIVE